MCDRKKEEVQPEYNDSNTDAVIAWNLFSRAADIFL